MVHICKEFHDSKSKEPCDMPVQNLCYLHFQLFAIVPPFGGLMYD